MWNKHNVYYIKYCIDTIYILSIYLWLNLKISQKSLVVCEGVIENS